MYLGMVTPKVKKFKSPFPKHIRYVLNGTGRDLYIKNSALRRINAKSARFNFSLRKTKSKKIMHPKFCRYVHEGSGRDMYIR